MRTKSYESVFGQGRTALQKLTMVAWVWCEVKGKESKVDQALLYIHKRTVMRCTELGDGDPCMCIISELG